MENKNRVIRSAFSEREPVNQPLSGEPTRTKQEFVEEVDINHIVKRWKQGIQPPPWMTSNTPRYGDFTNMPASFQDAYAIVEAGEAAFASLPLEFRRALDHDPRNLDKAPRELYEQFGLVKKSGSPESPNGDSDGSDGQRVQGDSDLPAKAPPGAKTAGPASGKAGKKPAQHADE